MQAIKLPKIFAATALVVAAFGAAPTAHAGIGVPQRDAGIGVPQQQRDIIAVLKQRDNIAVLKQRDIIAALKYSDSGSLKRIQMRKAGGDH